MQSAAKILVIPGSLRSGSFNKSLADAVSRELAAQGADVTRISLADYPLPLVDEDLKKEKGVPQAAIKLGQQIGAHDGVFICSPEYNASIPPLVKNMVDWVSLVTSDGGNELKPWKGRYVALGAASNGRLGGMRMLYHLRSVMMNVGTQVITEQVSVSGAASGFDESGDVKDERTRNIMVAACRSLIEHCTLYSRR